MQRDVESAYVHRSEEPPALMALLAEISSAPRCSAERGGVQQLVDQNQGDESCTGLTEFLPQHAWALELIGPHVHRFGLDGIILKVTGQRFSNDKLPLACVV
mmetsp:Transcript_64668/g.171198  ORF Transcript_64668/g.171198 Transcript_64668/m.171198 type:complete len:102 (-) Transcript_64668:8-313(-)